MGVPTDLLILYFGIVFWLAFFAVGWWLLMHIPKRG